MELSLIYTLLLGAMMAGVFYFDLTRYIIPNWLNLTVLALYPAFALTVAAPEVWWEPLAALGAMFAGGFLIYMFRLMGAGDIKLLAALAPWCGWSMTLIFLLIYTAMLGGALAIIVYVLRLLLPALLVRMKSEAKIPRLLTHGEPIPYGLAISVAFVILMARGDIPGLGWF